MLTLSRSWFRGLMVGLTLGAVLGATTLSRGTSGRNEATLEARVAALEAPAQHLVVVQGPLNGLAGPHLILEGVNVHIRSGSGTTDDGTFPPLADGFLTGLGNLIIGYNAVPPNDLAENERAGSHNLVVGDGHRYSSFGGFVAGVRNTLTDRSATVSGGGLNTASAPAATVSGGSENQAAATAATIGGGQNNVAGSDFCWRASAALNTGC